MQPKTEVGWDPASLQRIQRTIRNMALGKRQMSKEAAFAMPLPDEVGIQLTHRCNLRCRHCFQWNDQGLHQHFTTQVQNQDLDFAVVTKILAETAAAKSNLYLWGGEPLCYREWDQLSRALEADPRWTVLCTNGMELEKNLDSLLKISPHLALLISVDGFAAENDAVRGRGTYQKVLHNIDLLLKLKRQRVFQGEVSVNCVISDAMIGKLYDLAVMFEALGINTLYFCFPWYISPTVAQSMDHYFRERFSWLRPLSPESEASWHSYTFQLNPDRLDALKTDLTRINQRTWKIRMRYQPALELDEISGFVGGQDIRGQKRTRCVGIANRMNVMPSGEVTVCKLFPEFVIGDLGKNSVAEVWHSPEFQKARQILNCGLTPVCSKCVLLYLHGV